MAKKKSGVLTVDPENMDLENLEDHEARWLQDRGELPPEYEKVPVTFNLPDGSLVSNDSAYFLEAAKSFSIDDNPHLAAEVERRAKEMVEQMMKDQQIGSIAVAGENHGNATNDPQDQHVSSRAKITPEPSHDELEDDDADVDDDDEDEEDGDDDGEEEEEAEDYLEGWNQDKRRAELSSRGLDVEGDKATLIARLVEDDNKE